MSLTVPTAAPPVGYQKSVENSKVQSLQYGYGEVPLFSAPEADYNTPCRRKRTLKRTVIVHCALVFVGNVGTPTTLFIDVQM